MKKTTKKDFETFRQSFLYWQNRFGLSDYRITFRHERLDDESAASLSRNVFRRVATATLQTEYPNHADIDPELSGKHEAIHLLISRLSWLATCRYIDETEINEEEEALVMKLEKLFDKEA